MAKLTREDMEFERSGFDDFSGQIYDAWFEVIPEYAEKAGVEAVSLVCMVDADGFTEGVKLGGFSCGAADKWEISKDSKELTAQKGKSKFHEKSNAGIFARELMLMAGDGDLAAGQDKFLERGYRMTEAAFYIGLNSRWLRRETPNPVDPSKTVRVQLPTDYLKFGTVKAAPSQEDFVSKLVEMAAGKTERDLKRAIASDSEASSDFKNQVINKGLIAKLKQEGKLIEDSEGKFI